MQNMPDFKHGCLQGKHIQESYKLRSECYHTSCVSHLHAALREKMLQSWLHSGNSSRTSIALFSTLASSINLLPWHESLSPNVRLNVNLRKAENTISYVHPITPS